MQGGATGVFGDGDGVAAKLEEDLACVVQGVEDACVLVYDCHSFNNCYLAFSGCDMNLKIECVGIYIENFQPASILFMHPGAF